MCPCKGTTDLHLVTSEETASSVVGCDFHSAEDVIRHPYPATPTGVTSITANRFAGRGAAKCLPVRYGAVTTQAAWCTRVTHGYKWDAPTITASADTVKAGQGVSVRVAGYNTAMWTIAGRCTLVTGSFRVTLPVGVYDIKAQGVGPGTGSQGSAPGGWSLPLPSALWCSLTGTLYRAAGRRMSYR